MTTTEERLYDAVLTAPDSDEPRRAYAQYVRSFDPGRAKLIETQLERSVRQRMSRYEDGAQLFDERALVEKRSQEWARTLLKYCEAVEFHRGFIEGITVDAELFLEYGEWLFVNAPIRHVRFAWPASGRYPIEELAASPFMERLVGVTITHCLDDAQVIELAASPHLGNCMWLDLSHNILSLKAFDAVARSPSLRQLLFLARDTTGDRLSHYFPGQRLVATDRLNRWDGVVTEWGPVSPEGQQLERELGYIPWLHRDNFCKPYDARWFVEHGVLPVKPSGSPVE